MWPLMVIILLWQLWVRPVRDSASLAFAFIATTAALVAVGKTKLIPDTSDSFGIWMGGIAAVTFFASFLGFYRMIGLLSARSIAEGRRL